VASFRILGSVEVDDGGTVVDLGGSRQRAVLAILLLHRGEPVAVDRLVDQLYGERPPRTAVKSLQAHISRLRRALGDGRLQTGGGGYALALAPGELDADRFAALIDEGRRAATNGETDAAARAFDEALALWRGPPFGELRYEDFVQAELARLEELRWSCVEERIDVGLAQGRHEELRPELERLVAEHPLRERLRGQLMLALYRSGRQAEALDVYRGARRALVDELGVEPGRPLQELERAILNHDVELDLRGAGVAAAQAPARHTAGVFVGRDLELAELDGALADARGGRGRLVLLSGEAGIGKSRLADEASARARAAGARVLWGRCWEAGGAPAYWPWVQALRSHVRECSAGDLRSQLGHGAAELVQLLPELREHFPELAREQPTSGEGGRFRLFEATAEYLRAIARDRPLIVVLDDVHAADAPSLLLLEFIAGALADAHVLLLVAFREPELEPGDPTASALIRVARAGSRSITLSGLQEPDVAAFIEQAGPTRPSQALVHAIAAETEGNPLFVGEIVRLLTAEGRLDDRPDSNWRLAIPDTVKSVIGRRLERLSPRCRTVLSVGSVVGREFDLELLEQLSEEDRGEVLVTLDEAISARVVADVPGAPGRLRFTHALVRDTLYDALPTTQRLDLHRRTAERIVPLVDADPARLSELAHHAFHALPALETGLAVEYAKRAAVHASELLAHEEAARLYGTALHALASRGVPDRTVELTLTLGLGEALARAGEMPAARDAFLRAAVLARATGDPDGLAAAALGYGGRIVWTRANGDRLVVSLLMEALEALGEAPTPARARILARLSGALRDEPDARRRIALGEEAVALAKEIGDAAALAYALDGLSVGLQASRDLDRRLALAAELEGLAQRVHDREAEVDVHIATALVHFELGDMPQVRYAARAVARLAEELRQPAQLWIARANEALLALHEGDLEAAERLATAARVHGAIAQPREAEGAYAMQLYQVRAEQGRAGELRDLLQAVAEDLPARPLFRCALARLDCEADRDAEARHRFEELAVNEFEVVPLDQEWLLSLAFLGDVCVLLGDEQRAEVLYDKLLPFADKLATDVHEGSTGAVARSLGLLADVLGRHDDAVGHLAAAIEINLRVAAKIWVARSQADLAEVHLRAGDRSAAGPLLDAAAATARELGLVVLGERAARARAT
jgi:DNA-binding SARP family transcriptional activator